jgi:HK97 gp10 family phage protein
MITLSISGMGKLQAAILAKEKTLVDGVGLEISASMLEINNKQKQLAPVDKGFLRSSLHVVKVTPLNQAIISSGPGSSYAPYQEFGTGGLVEIPAGLEDEAAQFKGKTGRKVNMRAQPFFFPPFFEEKPKFLARVEKLLTK